MANAAGFWDWIARRYAKQPIADQASYQFKLEQTRKYLTHQSRVLEFGCGTGSTAIAHAPCAGKIHALDISDNMLTIAREKARVAGVDNLTFERGDLHSLKSPDADWDVVLGLNVLHLVENLADEIQRVRCLLKPGGVFISSTPCIGDMRGILKFIAPLFKWLPVLPAIHCFTLEEYRLLLERNGFAIEMEWRPAVDQAAFVVARKLEE